MRLRMEDGTVVDTGKATRHYAGERDFDGSNWIQRSTKDQWQYQDLYRSRKGRYYLIHSSAWQGSQPRAEWVSKESAAAWLTLNDHEIPEELAAVAEQVTE